MNCDGFVSGSELAPCASDLNGDGLTAIEGLLGLLNEFGCTVDCSQVWMAMGPWPAPTW